MEQKQSVYQLFAENLRTLCLRRGTIAQVCRDLDINRQQFNKYLSGATLPNVITLAKIANHFDVEQAELFQDQASKGKRQSAQQQGPIPAELFSSMGELIAQSSDIPLSEGCYLVYYPWFYNPGSFVTTVAVIFRRGGITFFRRYVNLPRAQIFGGGQMFLGRHDGIVFNHGRNLCFLGRNSRGAGELTLQAYDHEKGTKLDAMTGLSMVIARWGEYVSFRSTLTYFGPLASFRDALKRSKRGPLSAAEVPQAVRESLSGNLNLRVPRMIAFDFADRGQ